MPTLNPLLTIPCCACDATLTLGVQKSAAGYFIGYRCDECGPHSRASGYTKDKAVAKAALKLARDPSKWIILETRAGDDLYDAQ